MLSRAPVVRRGSNRPLLVDLSSSMELGCGATESPINTPWAERQTFKTIKAKSTGIFMPKCTDNLGKEELQIYPIAHGLIGPRQGLKRLARKGGGRAARGGRSDLGSYLPPAAAQPADCGLALKARLPP